MQNFYNCCLENFEQFHIGMSHYNRLQFSSFSQSCLTLCDPMDCSMPGFPVHHQLPEFTQTHVHWVGDAIQPSHSQSSSSPSAFNLSEHQGLFQWINSFHQVAKVLEFQFQHQSFQWMNIQAWFPLGWTGLISLQSKGFSRVFSSTIVQRHQFFSAQPAYCPALTSIHDYWKIHSFARGLLKFFTKYLLIQ